MLLLLLREQIIVLRGHTNGRNLLIMRKRQLWLHVIGIVGVVVDVDVVGVTVVTVVLIFLFIIGSCHDVETRVSLELVVVVVVTVIWLLATTSAMVHVSV